MQARMAREFFMNIQLSMFKISGNSRRIIVRLSRSFFVLHTTVITPVIRLIFTCNRKKSFIRFSIDAQDEQGLKRQFCKKQISPFKRRKRVSRLPVNCERDCKVSLGSYPVQQNRSFSLSLAPPLKQGSVRLFYPPFGL